MKNEGKLFIIGSVATLLALTDNSIKERVEDGRINNGVIEKTNGFAEIEKHHNRGIPLNKLDNHTDKITLLSSFILILHAMNTGHTALSKDDKLADAANTLILGGAISNTYDRISKGYVVDYLKIGKKRVIYNLSDFFIIGGVLLTVVNAFKELIFGGNDY